MTALELASARGAFTFPFHEPDGYAAANDAVLAAARDADGLLVPFCRVNPHDSPVPEAERSLAAGAKGIKLHPRAEQFTLDHPQVRSIVALANERSLPVLIHAGRGIPALGLDAVELAEEFPDVRLILAHAGICDLSWIWRVAGDLPNLLFDTAWWIPADLEALFTLVPPGQIVFASDAPYGNTFISAAFQLRWALQLGMSHDQIRSIASGQSLRIAAGEPLKPAGPPIGERERAPHLLLDRVAFFVLFSALGQMRGVDPTEMLALARLACDVPDRDRRRACVRGDPLAARRLRRVLGGAPRRAPAHDVPDPRRHRRQDPGCPDPGRGPQSRFRSQISLSPVRVSRSSTSSIVSRMNGTSTPARPPVAITRVDEPSSTRNRRTIPST